MSTILGLSPSTPTSQDRKTPKSLQGLSLSQLSNRIRDLNVAAGIGIGDVVSRSKIKSNRELTLNELRFKQGEDLDLGNLEVRRDVSEQDLTRKQIRKRSERGIQTRLAKLGEAKRSLITSVTGARTERATQVTTLLGRGIQ